MQPMISMIFGALLPVFGLILLGYGCGRVKFMGDHAFEVFNRFVISITLPVLTFRTLAKMDAGDLAVPSMVVAVVGGSFIIYAIGYVIERLSGRTMAEANIAGLGACFSNTGFVGLPIGLLAFGPQSLAPIAVTMALFSSVVFGFAVLMSELAGNDGQSLGKSIALALRAMARNPLIIMSLLGMIWAKLHLPLSGPVDTMMQTLAGATAPCALVAIGLFIALPRETATPGPISRVVAMKLVLHPIITALLVMILPVMPPLWGICAILMAAMPSGASSFVLAGKAGRWAMELSAWTITLSTSGAAITLIPILWWLGSR